MKLSVRRKYNFSQILQLTLLFLVSLNFANLYFYLIFLTFFVCIIKNIRGMKVDVISVFLALLSICYILFYSPTRGSYTTIFKQFSYPMCYLIGLNLFNATNNKNQSEQSVDEQIKLSILVVSMGTLLHYLLNASINIDSLLRNTADYWTGEVVSATGQALLPVMSIGVFCVWLFGNHPVWIKILSLLGLIAIFAYNFVLAGRTIIMLSAIIICVSFLYIQKHLHPNARMRTYFFLCVIIVGILILFLNNAWGVRDWILNSNFSNRFNVQDVSSDIRIERKLIYFSRMLEFPFGGGHLRSAVGGYAHELYLDIFSDVGIIGYAMVIVVTIAGAVDAIKVFKCDSLSVETRSLVLCVFIGINVVFFLEPILQGEPWFFCIFCFLIGVIRSEVSILKQRV